MQYVIVETLTGCRTDMTRSRHAPEGQKPVAQGIALGMLAAASAPCKGKSVE